MPAKQPTRKTFANNAQQDIEEQIRARAYQLYEERGKTDGNDVEDWLTAERQVRGTHADKAAA